MGNLALGKNVRVTGLLENFLLIGGIGLWLYVLVFAYSQPFSRAKLGVVFLGSCGVIYAANELIGAINEDNKIDVILLVVSSIIIIYSTIYTYTNFREMYVIRVGYSLEHEYIMAVFFIAAITYLTWREFGLTFLFLVGGTLLYGYFGQQMPGVLAHGGLSIERLLGISMVEIQGLYGSINQIIAAWVALFLLYAGLIQAYGAFDIITISALKTGKYLKSGVFQTAVIASAIVGSISGSRAANAAMTGSITIPIMVDSGLKPQTAAAIEADASTLGQILPPVMGASGFLMASFVGISYADVMVAASIPAFIMVASIAVAVHYTSVREVGDVGYQEEKIDQMVEDSSAIMDPRINLVVFGAPFAILVYFLGIARISIPRAALYTVAASLVTGWGYTLLKESSENSNFVALKDTLEGFKKGAIILAPIGLIAASINLVVDILMATGVPSAITLALINLSGGILLITVILSMIICIILGLGMPTVAAYTIVAILLAPTLIHDFGVPTLSAHFFVLYAALLSGITPPVASTCAVTSGIAQSNFLRTCMTAVRIFAPLFVIPIAFVYKPEIITDAFSLYGLFTSATIFYGGVLITYSLNKGFDRKGAKQISKRVIFIILGILIMVHPSSTVLVASLVTSALLLITERDLKFETLSLPGKL